MSARRRVVFAGAYGIQNAGDDAPLLVLARGLRRRFPAVELELDVLARHPDPLLAAAAGARFLANPEHESRAAARGRHFRGLNPGDDRTDLQALEEAIRTADLVVAGAGNVLTDLALDLFRGPVPLFALYAFLADLHRIPLMLYGISAGPLSSARGRELSGWIARRAAAVTVRDEASRALLAELAPEAEVELLPDPVLGLEPADDQRFERALAAEGIPRRGARPRLALALRDLSFLGRDRALVRDTLARLAASHELLFVPQCTDADCDDRAEVAALLAELPGVQAHVVRTRHAPDVLMRFYETAAATLAIRLHGAVFSAMAGTPVVALAYLPKVRGFLERIGAAEGCFELDRATPELLAHALTRAAAGRDSGERLRGTCRTLGADVMGYVERAAALLDLRPGYSGSSKQYSASLQRT
jgi:polysaccharide pyruvyl transferase WcaK-like protein